MADKCETCSESRAARKYFYPQLVTRYTLRFMRKYNYSIDNSIQDVFRKLPPSTLKKICKRLAQLGPKSGLTYVDEHGKTVPITLTLRPRLISHERLRFLWHLIRTLDHAFSKISHIYREYPAARPLFPFNLREQDWMEILEEPHYVAGRVVSRWDANTTFSEKDWENGFSFFEVNGVGVGGLWYGPACADVTLKVVVPEIQILDPHFRPSPLPDMSYLLLDSLLRQRKKIGRMHGVIAFTMEKASGSNYVEFIRMARQFTRLGYPSIVCEPTDFRLNDNEIFFGRKKIDSIYRDTTLEELCRVESEGHDLSALREAFKRGQVISSLEGEFDHKSAFEVFTHSDYSRFFTTQERRLFQKYILWTRLVRETKTTDPKGRPVDLIPYILKHQSVLVLKPNRLYGGKGVVLGRDMKPREWHRKIDKALRNPGDYVIQKLGELRTRRFFRPEGANWKKVREKDLYVVSGFFAAEKGLGIVGRMSERTVVNVARRGGLSPILQIR